MQADLFSVSQLSLSFSAVSEIKCVSLWGLTPKSCCREAMTGFILHLCKPFFQTHFRHLQM